VLPLRTLLSYIGEPTSQGGGKLLPDLAEGLPEISATGLKWTFHIKRGVHYAPPFQDVEVTSGDFVHALDRVGDPVASASSGVPLTPYFDVIAGFEDYVDGKAQTISGLDTPDDHTLVVTLTQATGDLGYRFSLAGTAPIPPSPVDPSAQEGAAQGHEADYGRYLVATGPYMLEGSEAMDFTKPALLQPAAAGYRPGRSITLVRNPAWDPANDPLRPAYVDRIEIGITEPSSILSFEDVVKQLASQVDRGTLDMVFDSNPPSEQVRKYQSDPVLRSRLHRDLANTVRYIAMNLAMPPFDDPHVRQAVSLVMDRETLSRLAGTLGVPGEPATHMAVDSVENGLLGSYDPYPTDLSAARSQMAASRYDSNHDGRCDAPACHGITFQRIGQSDAFTALERQDLAKIGITLAAHPFATGAAGPADRVGIQVGLDSSWQSDYPSASTFFLPLFSSAQIVSKTLAFRTFNANFSLVGASRGELRGWGYGVSQVPTVDPWVQDCLLQVGEDQFQCWAEADQYLMQEIIPAVPLLFDQTVRVVSARVRNYSIDQFTALPALDHIALAGAGGS
jgi:peptide/nickel transport system substrate-binding protein